MPEPRGYTITIFPGGRRIKAAPGETLLSALRNAGIFLNAPCGGQGTCKKCTVILEGNGPVLACQVPVESDLSVTLPEDAGMRILTASASDSAAVSGSSKLGLAFDIGTTTIAGYLVERATGAQLAAEAMVNPQSAFGADVISRLQYAVEHGEESLTRCIREALQRLLAALVKKAQVSADRITAVSAVGNTAMHHLLLGLDVSGLATAPFQPASLAPFSGQAIHFGLSLPPETPFLVPPPIAGFVGADTVSCLLDTELDTLPGPSLLIDIGTNGELVLANQGRLVVCSAAAGPAFEGARITMGLRAEPGAIDKLTYTAEGRYGFSVIGDSAPRGLCGSGLLDAAALLKKLGLLTHTGRLLSGAEAVGLPLSDRLIERDGQPAFLVSTMDEGGEVSVTQGDLREFQLSKGAIRAAIELLLSSEHLRPESLKQVLIAGAFGCYLNNWSAVRVGLYPGCFLDRLVEVGNAAGGGAIRLVSDPDAMERATRIAASSRHLELASHPEFLDAFMDAMAF